VFRQYGHCSFGRQEAPRLKNKTRIVPMEYSLTLHVLCPVSSIAMDNFEHILYDTTKIYLLRRKEISMSTIDQPKGDKMQRAIKWISNRLKDDETQPSQKLIEEASREFNLSPNDEVFLLSFYKKKS